MMLHFQNEMQQTEAHILYYKILPKLQQNKCVKNMNNKLTITNRNDNNHKHRFLVKKNQPFEY